MTDKKFSKRLAAFRKELTASMQTSGAVTFVAKNNKEWREYGVNLAGARMQGYIATREARYECMTPKHTEIRLDTDDQRFAYNLPVLNDKQAAKLSKRVHLSKTVKNLLANHGTIEVRVRNSDAPPTWRPVTRERHVELTRNPMGLSKYKLALSKIEWTTDVVVTAIQLQVIDNFGAGNWGKILCGLRRTDTGATALLIREDNAYVVLFEDGEYVKSYNVPEFNGSWFFDKKVKRTAVVAEQPKLLATANEKSFTINRGYK